MQVEPYRRVDQRTFDTLRPVEIIPGFHRNAEGSVLYRAGGTVVLCTASVDEKVPPFLEGRGKGWVTAEYQMHPRANKERRESRDGRGKAPSGRTQEIQRLIGRALRAAVDLELLGERQISIDCDVLEADGGTRTAAITGSFVALAIAIHKLRERNVIERPVIREPVAAVSCGYVNHNLLLDLAYIEDSRADVDLNLVATKSGALIEVQGTAEGAPIPRAYLDAMMEVGQSGIRTLVGIQERTLASINIDLASLVAPAG